MRTLNSKLLVYYKLLLLLFSELYYKCLTFSPKYLFHLENLLIKEMVSFIFYAKILRQRDHQEAHSYQEFMLLIKYLLKLLADKNTYILGRLSALSYHLTFLL